MTHPFDDTAYRRHGFAVLPGAVPSGLLAALAASIDRIQAGQAHLPTHLRDRLTLERDLPDAHRDGITADAVGEAIFLLGDPVSFDPVFSELLHQPRLTAAIRQAVGASEIVAHFMNVTIKHPRFGRRIGWHRDFPNAYACPSRPSFVRAMLCLDGMTQHGGGTEFLPGSHLHDLSPGDSGAAAITARCEPGDVVLIHPRVLHGGGMNRSPTPRRNVVLQAGDAADTLVAVPDQEAITGLALA